MEDQRHDGDAAGGGLTEHSERRPYVRPELVRYGGLQEVTRAYTQTRTCRNADCQTA